MKFELVGVEMMREIVSVFTGLMASLDGAVQIRWVTWPPFRSMAERRWDKVLLVDWCRFGCHSDVV